MREVGVAQSAAQFGPHLHESMQIVRLDHVLRHELVEREALDPFHLEQWERFPADSNTLLMELEADSEGELCFIQVGIDLRVAFLETGHFAREELDGPHGAVAAFELVNVREV